MKTKKDLERIDVLKTMQTEIYVLLRYGEYHCLVVRRFNSFGNLEEENKYYADGTIIRR